MAIPTTHDSAVAGRSRAVPVTMGSPRFVTNDAGRFRCTHAWFPPHATLEPHVHDRATFGVMLGGGFELGFSSPAIRHRSLDCRPATVFTEPAGETHGNRVGAAGATVVVVQLDPEAADLAAGPVRALLLDRINHFRSERIALRARKLARELHQGDRIAALAIESLVLAMIVDAARRDDRWTRSTGPSAWLDRAEEYVRAHFRDPIRIADIAAAVGIHPAHLASTFSDVHGVPLGTFVRRLRLDWAAERLTRTDAAIASIACEAGFADQSHLTRTFKRYTGRTPAAYRRAARR